MAQISKATERNWKKLNSDSERKLTKRANKTRSRKRVVVASYLDFVPARQLLAVVLEMDVSIENIIYSLCVSCLKHVNIFERPKVAEFVSQYSHCQDVEIRVPEGTWDGPYDVLGFVYQSLLAEGRRNQAGAYYTNKKVADYMVGHGKLADGETFLDPCCGSGAFLLSVQTDTPECLYGFDIDPVAVMIAGTNLLVKYSKHDFVPKVYCCDFLQSDSRTCGRGDMPSRFDHIYTNPPWGADRDGQYVKGYPEIKSKERASMVVVEALKRLAPKGSLCLLLPTSLLKIKVHNDVRKHILANAAIQQIDLYSDRFDGVFTDYFSIKLSAAVAGTQRYTVSTGNETGGIELSEAERLSGTIVVERLGDTDSSIVKKIEAMRHDDLTHSRWALGIVTGDNRNKLKAEKAEGLEPVFAGRQVAPFKLQQASAYILFEPDAFQQCAREELYRAPEKLVYRFIAKYPIVAYDDKQCLCLNSANILIPELDGISVKSAAALLNSSLYHYYYSIKFADIKVLKGNLQELPFPRLTKDLDARLGCLVTDIQVLGYSVECQCQLDEMVYSLFEITPTEQEHIRLRLKQN